MIFLEEWKEKPMYYVCDKHGGDPPRTCVSVSIDDAIESNTPFNGKIYKPMIMYPDYTNSFHDVYLDEADFLALKTYLESPDRPQIRLHDAAQSIEVSRLSGNGELVLIEHDKAAKALNDRLFRARSGKRMRSRCQICIQEFLSSDLYASDAG